MIKGIHVSDFSGRSVSAAGDINGDGVDDVIIGAYRADQGGNGSAGESYVVFGSGAVGVGFLTKAGFPRITGETINVWV